MASAIADVDRVEQIGLRQQANYWRAQHARAAERETALKGKVRGLEAAVGEQAARADALRRQVAEQQACIAAKDDQIETLKARVAWLQQQVFGRKTEQRQDEPRGRSGDAAGSGAADRCGESANGQRRRGQQPGAKGHGRRRRPELPSVEEFHELPPAQQRCPRCGRPFRVLPGTEDSEQIEWEVIVRRRVEKRVRYVPTCRCGAVPGIVTAACPAKLIPKGLFAISFWVRLLLEKYLFQRPLYRTLKMLALEGLHISQGTITGGLQRIGVLLQPVYTCLLERSRSATRWKMDETRWMVFAEVEGKTGHRWWLWVVITDDTVVFLLEPTRSAEVPRAHLGEDPEGIILADRYRVYQALGVGILVAFCWSHVRRDFVRIRDGYEAFQAWGEAWVARINELFCLNDRRLEVQSDPDAFPERDRLLRRAVDRMAEVRDQELADPALQDAQRKALESLRTHWEGCTLFVDHPEIPMDNNESERELRNPAVGRKNYWGSGAVWSGRLTAVLFSIFQTLLKNRIDPRKWLTAYFQACAENGGLPPQDLETFLPWNLNDEQRAAWQHPEHPP